jgi:hypothetical protein
MKSVTDTTVALAASTLRAWLSEIYPPEQVNRCIMVDAPKRRIVAKIWTATNEHTITAALQAADPEAVDDVRRCRLGNSEDALAASYLGAASVSRLQRPGETWNRGNDLPDGRFSAETWRRILAGIVRYEAQGIKSTRWRE